MTAAPALAAELWTASRIATVQTCLRKHHYRYVLGIDGGTSDVARFGTVGHSALEHWLRRRGIGDEDVAALEQCDALPDVYERARLRAVILGYTVRWGGVQWRVLAVELEFSYQLGDITIAGKMDAIVEVLSGPDAGGVFVVEHKFTKMDSAPGSTYWERLTIDAQVSIYVDGARCAGYDVRGVIYDVIAKPGHEPARATPVELRKYTQPVETKGKGCPECGGRVGGKGGPKPGSGLVDLAMRDDATGAVINTQTVACMHCNGTGWREQPRSEPARLYANQRDTDETPEDFEARVAEAIAAAPDSYYRRAVIVRLDHELPLMRTDIADTVRLARVAHLFELAPRSTGACSKFGSLCHFFPICSGAADVDDTSRFPRARPHAELAAPTTPTP